ncbi:MAG: hypothetical protein ACOCSM_00595 [Bacillota bacterium]
MAKEILETKRRYSILQNGPVRLQDYMVFKNVTGVNRSLVMRFYNQASVPIKRIEFEITQFDVNGDTLHKGSYAFDDVNGEAFSHFIPFKKIKLHESCTEIEYRLLTAVSEHDTWTDGFWESESVEEAPRKRSPRYSVNAIRHNRLTYPYFITLAIIVLFILTVIAVFKAING